MEAFRVSSTEHESASKFIDDDDFAVLYHIVYIPLHHGVGSKGLVDVVVDFHIGDVRHVLDTEEFFCFLQAFLCVGGSIFFFVYGIVCFTV